MNNNDVIRKIRFIFDYSDDLMIKLFANAGATVTRAEISDWLKKDEDENFKPIYDHQLSTFLNGFIVDKRGKQDGVQIVNEKKLNNNQIFRKIKIALSLKDTDILEMYDLVDLRVGKHELSAIFRKPEQHQYRLCKDQFLRNFLLGLQFKIKGGQRPKGPFGN